MRILIINKYAPADIRSGGAEKRLDPVFSQLPGNPEVHLLCARSKSDVSDSGDFTIHQPVFTGNVYLAHVLLTFLLPFYALLIRPDVVYEDISAAPWFAPWTCFWIPHVSILHNFNGQQLLERGKRLQGSILAVLDKMMLACYKSQRVITVSQHVRDKLIANGFSRVEIIYNGVDEVLLNRETRGSNSQSLLYVGRLEFRKGVDLLFDVWEEVSNDFDLHVVGRNEDDYDIPATVTYHGYVSTEEKFRLFEKADLLLIPSRWEGYGIVVLEAAASNTSVIGNDVPGLRQAVNDVDGELVDFSNPQAVVETIYSLILTDEEENGNDIPIRSWKEVAEETMRILEDEVREG